LLALTAQAQFYGCFRADARKIHGSVS
jgi:hypothetical protein